LANSTFDHNVAGPGIESAIALPDDGGSGGAIRNEGNFCATACTFSANSAGSGGPSHTIGAPCSLRYIVGQSGKGGSGGALANSGKAALTNCTFSRNSSGVGGDGRDDSNGSPGGRGGSGGDGGAIYNGGTNQYVMAGATCSLVACTLSANWAGPGGIGGTNPPAPCCWARYNGMNGRGGGICNTSSCPSCGVSVVQLLNTVVAGNHDADTGSDLLGVISSLGHNLVGQADDGAGITNGVNSDLVGTGATPLNPQLGPLADNGGSTLTMALLHGSPALESGDDSLLEPPNDLGNDQRGFQRKSGGHVDIGAVEFQFGVLATNLVPVIKPSAEAIQISFTNSTPGATFSVLSATNISVPVHDWSVLGQAARIATAEFLFIDFVITNDVQRFYRVSSP